MLTSGRPRTILLIDDNVTNLKVAIEHLQTYNFEILTARNGEAGFARALETQPDLILLDVQMPGIDGIETCRRLKANPATDAIPVIFMTALGDVNDKVRGLEAGGVDYIIKPFEAAELLARVNIHLTLAQLQRDLAEKNEALQTANTQLEDKVRQRTAEITEANAALAKANQQLQELDRLKSAFLGVVTHELRSPVANIAFSLQLLERYGVDHLRPEQREQLQQLNSGVQEAKQMIESLVKTATFLSKQGALRWQPLNLGQLIENAVFPLKFQADRQGLTLTVTVANDLPPLSGDEERLTEAIYHLAHNAVKFTPAGGTLSIQCWAEVGRVSFEVNDTGVGVPADRLPTLWDSFAQMADPLQRGMEGLGLGLSLVKYVVNAHGGEVWARSQVGAGSTFGFSLPIDKPAPR